ncbi:thioredoxin domain-containing protein 6-like isoform 2-T2 [Synchiropus picturatus]
MAAKKKEGTLQVSATNTEQWEALLTNRGLTVVDVYQEWCGPCKAVVRHLQKIKNEVAEDDLLHFATAEADSIDVLEKYRGKCEPAFLFYRGGKLVAKVRGARVPDIQRLIKEQLAKEKLFLEQGGERNSISDDEQLEEEEEEEEETDGETQQAGNEENYTVPSSKSFTVAILKPNAVAHNRTSEIIMKIQDAGFEILAQEERTLGEAEAREFYRHRAGELFFEDLVQFMCSGPSHVLVLSKAEDLDVVPLWLEFIGPADTEEARREKPDSLRAQYGTETLFNAVHGSQDGEQASRELAFLFPNFQMAPVSEQEAEEERVERTLALIRPDVASEQREEVLAQIHNSGFTVALQREVMMSEEQVRRFYFKQVEDENVPALMQTMTRGPVLLLVLVGPGAVGHWRALIGPSDVGKAKEENPECLGAQFAVEGDPTNQLHGSDTQEDAEQAIDYFFPKQQTLAIIKPDAFEHKERILEEIQSRGFAVTQKKEMTLTKETAEEFYKEHREETFFSQMVDSMCRRPCLMLVLEKENAVEEWRGMMGPTDPQEAKSTSPNSLRARFATDVLSNCVHGSCSEEQAQEKIQLIFGQEAVSTGDSDGGTNGAGTERTVSNSAITYGRGCHRSICYTGL